MYISIRCAWKKILCSEWAIRGFYNNSIFITGTGGLYRVSSGETQIYRGSCEKREQNDSCISLPTPFWASLFQSYASIEFTSNSFVQRITTETKLRTSLGLMGFWKAETRTDLRDDWHHIIMNVHISEDYIIIKMFLANKICRRSQ